jgi:DnaJ-domain-containing protein 1
MSSVEVFVVLFGLWAGYMLVSTFWRSKRNETNAQAENKNDPAQKTNDGRSWFDVLEIRQTATADEIRTAYKSQMSKYHPDKVASLGEELKAVAERKAKEITEAYRDALAQIRQQP